MPRRRRKKRGFNKMMKTMITYQLLVLVIIGVQLAGHDMIIRRRIAEVTEMVSEMSFFKREAMKLCIDGLKWRYWDK